MGKLGRRWFAGAAAVSALVMVPGIVQAAWPQPTGWPTILSQSVDPEVGIARGVKLQDAALSTDAGPLRIHRIEVDLTAPQLRVQAVAAGDKIFAGRGETVSSMANRTGAVAGINGDYYDIGQTYGPLNILVANGQLYRSPIGWAALAIDGQNRASIVRFQWSGQVMVLPGGDNSEAWQKSGQKTEAPSGQSQPLAAFNSFLGDQGIYLYDDKFGYSFPAPNPAARRVAVYLTKTADPTVYTVSSVVEDSAVPPVPPGQAVLIGHEQWGDWLKGNMAPGEKIQVGLYTSPDWRSYQTVIGGGPILLKGGQAYADPQAPNPGDSGRNPIIAVGLSADGRRMAMVAVDGRQPGRSVGLTRAEMASYLQTLGYTDAIGFDSGGSVDMVARLPGSSGVSVVNSPSDGHERPVADGLFVYSSLPPEPPAPPEPPQPPAPPSGQQPGGGGGQPGQQPGSGQPGQQSGQQPGTGQPGQPGQQPGQNPHPSTGTQPGGGGSVTLPDAGSLIAGRPLVWQETVAESRSGDRLSVQVLDETADRVRSADAGVSTFVLPVQTDAPAVDVHIPVGVWQALADKTGDSGVVVLQIPLGAYQVPVKAVKPDSGDKEILISVARPDGSVPVQGLADQTGGTPVADAVDFSVREVRADGTAVPVSAGKAYFRALIPLGQNAGGSQEMGVFTYDVARRVWAPVPARFVTTGQGQAALVAQVSPGTYVAVHDPKSFVDMKGHWAEDQVARLAAAGVIGGVDGQHFAPDRPVTRGQFAVLLVRALGLETVQARPADFADVSADAWNRHEIDVVAQEGLMSGVGGGRFAPDDPMTREQMIAVLTRAMRQVKGELPSPDTTVLTRFSDGGEVSNWAQGDVAVAVQTGVVVGSDGKLEPGKVSSRAEAAAMLGKMLRFVQLSD
ncbi:hypothetical protein CVV65_15590 [Kyrpidia spormannii]|uniref:SLH domain-containing protein n=1 Tax=Kyrpidia spormannii TaxID=2055160 RepID=A0A2K8NA07_9BACL|nr:S-layer homology domain-containing protein [Kyrpidia spormannii]ATY86176.1 hypothetical protein CVV65_15590 [Kyrpidia spormannii]